MIEDELSNEKVCNISTFSILALSCNRKRTYQVHGTPAKLCQLKK